MSSKTITFTSNYGNFDYRITATVGEEVNASTTWLTLQGLANICYRAAGSKIDKKLGAKVRKDVVYSEASAEVINAEVSDALTAIVKKAKEADEPVDLSDLKLSFAVTGEHQWSESGTAEPGKQAMLMAEMVAGTDAAAKFGGTKDSSVEELAGLIRAALAKVRKTKAGASVVAALEKRADEVIANGPNGLDQSEVTA